MQLVFIVIGFTLLLLANIGGIGYGLYLWGGTGMAFGLAAWTAFKVWITMIVSGVASLILSVFFKK